MSCWLTIPSAREPAEAKLILDKWRAQGYKIALWRDNLLGSMSIPMDHLITGAYPGYAQATNALVKAVLERDPACEWCIGGGDDVEPDPGHTAEEIARQCSDRFYEHFELMYPPLRDKIAGWAASASELKTFGVMQPTGDRFANGSIDRICGSPWLGREFCRRMYQGNGPLFEGYRHMFVDEELQEIALKLGVLWQRPDLIHLHRHFQREDDTAQSDAVRKPIPAHLVKWNTQEHWGESQKLFRARKAAGFPGHEPMEV